MPMNGVKIKLGIIMKNLRFKNTVFNKIVFYGLWSSHRPTVGVGVKGVKKKFLHFTPLGDARLSTLRLYWFRAIKIA